MALILGGSAALAQKSGDDRCSLMGQIAVSEWLELMSVLGGEERAAVDTAIERTHRATALYSVAACDMPAPTAAMDCVLVSDGGGDGPRARARQCLADSGLSKGQ